MGLYSRRCLTLYLSIFLVAVITAPAFAISAKSAGKIESSVNESLARFRKEVKGGGKLLGQANGVLIFPKVYKAGIGIGGEHGKGALRVGGQTVDYYSTSAASIGFQLGGQKKTVVIMFMTADSLRRFRNSSGWEVGVDGSVALVDIGAGGSIDTTNIKDPIIGFVFGQAGLMYNLTLEGSKIHKLEVK